MKPHPTIVLLVAAFLPPTLPAAETVAQPGGKIPGSVPIALVRVASGLVDPIHVASPNDGSGRLFVCERHGVVRVIKNGEVLPKPALDIKDKTLSSFLEEGLYAIEFHPAFKTNRKVYISYADLWFNGATLLIEYTMSARNPDQIDETTGRVILQIDFPYCNHHGGKMKFGPDGYLYVGVGDGGWEGDVLDVGQDLSTWMGKMLRVDVNVKDRENQKYTVPVSNPLAKASDPQLMVLFGKSELE